MRLSSTPRAPASRLSQRLSALAPRTFKFLSISLEVIPLLPIVLLQFLLMVIVDLVGRQDDPEDFFD